METQLARSEMLILLDQWAAWVMRGGMSLNRVTLPNVKPKGPDVVIQDRTALMIDKAIADLPMDARFLILDRYIYSVDEREMAENRGLNRSEARAKLLCTIDRIERQLGHN